MPQGFTRQQTAQIINQCYDEAAKSGEYGKWARCAELYQKETGEAIAKECFRSAYRRDTLKTPQKIIIPESMTKPDKTDYVSRVARLFYEDKRVPEDMDWDEMLDGFDESKEFRDALSFNQRVCRVRIETDTPIALCDISDVHLGSPYTDYKSLRRDLGVIINDDRIFMLKGGDWEDKFMAAFMDKAAPANQLHPATIQMATTDKIMKALSGKIIAATGGNHNRMDQRLTGISTEMLLHKDKPFPYLPEGGLVILTVGKTEYRILWKHQYKYNSQISKFNSHRWLRMLAEGIDIAILEHLHDPGIESIEKGTFDSHRTEINIRTGSYKIDDPFSDRFYKPGEIGPQAIILWPDKKKMLAMHGRESLLDAQVHLDGIRYGEKN